MAIYKSFYKIGSRPSQLVIDRYAVFVSSETYGEVVETRVFGDFCAEQELKLWVCNKADPENKGPIENVVGFVKKNFFSARNISCINDVLNSLPGWVERKNKRIHKATFKIPFEVFQSIEKEMLRPMVSSFSDRWCHPFMRTHRQSFISVEINSMPYIQYRSSKYSVPRASCFSTVYYKAISNKLYNYDSDRRYLCIHTLNECRGSVNQLDEHRKDSSMGWVSVMEECCRDFPYRFSQF